MPAITKARFMDGLVLWLPMTEGAGTTVKDLSKYGNNGTFGAGAAAPSWVAGLDGLPSVDFDGDDEINIGHDASLGWGTEDGSVIVLYEVGELDRDQSILYANAGGGNHGYGILQRSDNLLAAEVRPTGEARIVSNYTAGISIGELIHFAFTWNHDDGLVAGFVNGTLFGTESGTTGTVPVDADAYIGSHNAAAWFLNGKVHLVLIYNRALDPYEIRALYEARRRI